MSRKKSDNKKMRIYDDMVPDGTEYGIPLKKWTRSIAEYMEIYCEGSSVFELDVLNFTSNMERLIISYAWLVESTINMQNKLGDKVTFDMDMTVDRYAVTVVAEMLTDYLNAQGNDIQVTRWLGVQHFKEKFADRLQEAPYQQLRYEGPELGDF